MFQCSYLIFLSLFAGNLIAGESGSARITFNIFPESGTDVIVDGERVVGQKAKAVKPGPHMIELDRFGNGKKFRISIDSGETYEFHYRYHPEISYFAGLTYTLSAYRGDVLNGLSLFQGIRLRSTLITMSAFTTLPGDGQSPDKLSESYGIEALGIKYQAFNYKDRFFIYPGVGIGVYAAYMGEIEEKDGGATSYYRPHAVAVFNSDVFAQYYFADKAFALVDWKYMIGNAFHLINVGLGYSF